MQPQFASLHAYARAAIDTSSIQHACRRMFTIDITSGCVTVRLSSLVIISGGLNLIARYAPHIANYTVTVSLGNQVFCLYNKTQLV